jgi:hypothetical protein
VERIVEYSDLQLEGSHDRSEVRYLPQEERKRGRAEGIGGVEVDQSKRDTVLIMQISLQINLLNKKTKNKKTITKKRNKKYTCTRKRTGRDIILTVLEAFQRTGPTREQ